MNSFLRAVASVVLAFLIACSSTSGEVHERLKPLEGAASVELYALNPVPVQLEPVEPGTPTFHDYKVLGSATLSDPALATKLAGLISRGVAENEDTVAACFIPRHGVRVVRDRQTLDLVICFECLQIHVHDGRVTNSNGYDHWLTSQSVEPDVTRMFESLGLKIAPK